MIVKEYFKPESLNEAYELIREKDAVVLGGGAFLHLQKSEVNAVDLSKLNLGFIDEKEESVEIGAYATLREIEESSIIRKNFDIISSTCGLIMGVQIRNAATIGGCLGGKYGFSDVITALLSLDTDIELYKAGRMSLEAYLKSRFDRDIITKLIVKKENRKAVFNNLRNNSTDFSILNTAVSYCSGKFRITVGARPYGAVLAEDAMEYLEKNELNNGNIERAAEIASETTGFGSDIRGTAWYRQELCRVLVKRGIMEVIK